MTNRKVKKKSAVTKPVIEPHRELKRRVFLFDKETNQHEYTFEEHTVDFDTEYTILLSNNHTWAKDFRGEVQWTLVDDGNGVNIGVVSGSLDYSKYHTLRLLLNIINVFEGERETKYNMVEVSINSLIEI